MENSRTIEYDGVLNTTDDAWLLDIDGEEKWFPRSQCEIDKEAQTIEVPIWLLKKKGLYEE